MLRRSFFALILVGPAVASLMGSPANALTAGGWQQPVQLGVGALVDVSCPSSDFCATLTGDGQALTYDGIGWSAPQQASHGVGTELPSIGCASSALCVGFGGDGTVSTF